MSKIEKIKNFLTSNKKKIFFFITTIIFISGIWIIYKKYFSHKHTFCFAMQQDIAGLDPTNPSHTSSSYSSIYFNLVHATLLSKNANNELQPRLLETMPILDENKIIKCKLKNNIFFHNNQKMTTADIIFTFKRAQQNNHNQFEIIKKIELLNDQEFNIEFKNELSNWEWKFLLTDFFRVLNKQAIEKNENEGIKIGAGPYKLKKRKPNQSIDIEYFKDYYSNVLQTEKIPPTNIKIKISKDDNTLITELENQEIDAIINIKDALIKDIEKKINQNQYKNIKLLKNPVCSMSFMYFNKHKTKEQVRKIIQKSLDIQEIINELELPVILSKDILHNNLIGFNPDLNYHDVNISEAKTQFQNLKEEEKQIKCGASKETPFIHKIIEQLRHIGFQITLTIEDMNTLMVKAETKEYNFIFLGEGFETEYSHKYLEDYFLTNGNPNNFCGIDKDDQPFLEDKIKEAKFLTSDITLYANKIKEIDDYLYQKIYLLPLTTNYSFILTSKKIQKGFEQDGFSKFYNIHMIEIENT
ncbi:MAG: ABC transporter substrate-binding protein [Vigna little leaf phytoplasma]|nr:ABC transporter substrate-binding protein [Vigna little leaf phytoplasma]